MDIGIQGITTTTTTTTTTATTTTTTKMFIQGNPKPFCKKKGSLGALLLGVNTKNKLNKKQILKLNINIPTN